MDEVTWIRGINEGMTQKLSSDKLITNGVCIILAEDSNRESVPKGMKWIFSRPVYVGKISVIVLNESRIHEIG
jgi:hypothetical protein